MYRFSFLRLGGVASAVKSRAHPGQIHINGASPAIGTVSGTELVDLVSRPDTKSTSVVESPWTSTAFPRNSSLFPSEALDASRSKPIELRNVERLTTLWSLSNSHGVSWEELDDAFLSFHRNYIKAENDWHEGYEARWAIEYKRSEDVLRKTIGGDEAQVALAINRRRGKIRRMTYTRLARMRNKQVLKPFGLEQFSVHMKRFVEDRMLKREEAERNLS
jgi:hypothetical protein